MRKKVLVTGGAGYIGSHTAVALICSGIEPIIFDNFSNSHQEVINRIGLITGYTPKYITGDIREKNDLKFAFSKHSFDSVIHFAGLKSVSESAINTNTYYDNNVLGSICLLNEMIQFNVKHLVFSSSATVYGDPGYERFTEKTPTNPVNVYGRTKLFVEEFLRDLTNSDPEWRIACLRYFNPVGAHQSGLIGEDPIGTPNNLMPYISQVASGKLKRLYVFGNDYNTPDGTGMRDYIHVQDLAEGHIAALNLIHEGNSSFTVNLGSGRSISVLELISAFEQCSGVKINYEFTERRDGDLANYYADPTLANRLLRWKTKCDLKSMCNDTWRWQKLNPNGYKKQIL